MHEAIEHGYKIIEIFEVWHYPNSDIYDKSSQSGGLFTEYVDLFLKYKQEASGYPDEVTSNLQKEEYILNYLQKEGIRLASENIELNSGLRSVMKLMLNSFWGRFGMQTNKTKCKFISNLNSWYEIISDDNNIVHEVDFGIKDVLTVYYSDKKEFHDKSTEINVCIAAFVTCHARLKLLSELNKLQDRVLYFDTDSIIFLCKTNLYEPKLGDFLGELTNEISSKDGSYIPEFISAGPYLLCLQIGHRTNKMHDKRLHFKLHYKFEPQL